MAKHKPLSAMNLDDVRALVREVREEGLRIQRHYKRLEEEYSDWEDRVWALDKRLLELEEETGLKKTEITGEEKEYPDIDLGDDFVAPEETKEETVEIDWGD